MEANEKKTLIQGYLNAYNSFDLDCMMNAIHQDIEFKNVSGGETNASASGINEFQAIAPTIETAIFFTKTNCNKVGFRR